jgi:RNA polymerase sigma-54 factor
MRLDALQQLKLEQKLRLAPHMIQSMEILQLPLLALEERIAQELEKNPVLELREDDADAVQSDATPETTQEQEAEQDLVIKNNDNQDDFDRLDHVEDAMVPEEYLDQPRVSRASYSEEDPKMQALANTAAREVSLHDYLTSQFGLTEVDEQTRQAGLAMINHIEPEGYLKTPFETLAAESNLPNDPELWNRALTEIQLLEPAGVGARTPQECLLLQLQALPENRPVETELIAHYFEDLQKQEFQKISRQSGYSVDQIKAAVDFIRTRLVLHPGLAIGSSRSAFIVPDVIVDYDEDTETYKVTVPESSSPRLYIAGHYRRMLTDPGVDSQTRKFIRNNMQSARWLIDAVEQRRETLRKVAQSIVNHQKEFLDNGPRFLKPLPMAEVAEEVGVHVATVSRAVAEKYMLTPRGIFAMRSFFTGGLETESGESISYDAVREKIKEIIEAEDKTDPLNDDDIMKKLAEAGITIARRTIVKYRQQMNIPSSHKRREK